MQQIAQTGPRRHSAEVRSGERPGWHADLSVRLRPSAPDRVVCERSHRGPIAIQRPFHPEGRQWPHVYLLHPPGGFVGGDSMRVRVHVARAAAGLFTTPSAGKFYDSREKTARLTQRFRVTGDCEWLPAETIFFSGARARVNTRFDLTEGARVIAWEISCAGLPSSGEAFSTGHIAQALSVRQSGKLLLREAAVFEPASGDATARFGWQGFPVWATMICVAPGLSRSIAALRASCDFEDPRWAISAPQTPLDQLIVVRALDDSVEGVRKRLERVYESVRPLVFGRTVTRPRIWNT